MGLQFRFAEYLCLFEAASSLWRLLMVKVVEMDPMYASLAWCGRRDWCSL